MILEDGTEIHMLAERKYPLTKETLERMLSLRHQVLASPEQTAFGKDFSNPLIADSLLKTICCVARLLRCCNEKLKNFKISKSSSSSKKGLKNRSVFKYILQPFKKLILKKHEF
ncbi:hypothetical protein Tco_1543473 [Tanacetum coccineum]